MYIKNRANCAKRLFSVVLVALMIVGMLSACAGSGPSSNAGASTDSSTKPQSGSDGEQAADPAAANDGELAYKGTITMYAQSYSPDKPTETRPYPPTKFRDVAAAYKELHPDIDIEFLVQLEAGQDYLAWLKTKLAGGMAPDIFWASAVDLNGGFIPTGSFQVMNSFLERPNRYVEGNTKWQDLFHDSLMKQLVAANGDWNLIDADYVGTAVIYNEEMFKKAGIDKVPETWSEFTEVNQKLLEAGMTPWAYSFGNNGDDAQYITWFTRLFHTNFYAEDFEKLAVQGSKNSLNSLEICVAFKNGYFGPDDPRWMGFWPLLKEQTEYLQKDCISAASTRTTILNMFVNEQIAMYFDGSWAGNSLRDAKCAFDYASFPFPYPDSAATELATSLDSSPAIGGPFAAFQYTVSTEKSNNTMSNDKLEACIDWMMYITTPENNSAIVNELGSFIPTIKGAEPLPENAELVRMLSVDPLVIDAGFQNLGPTPLEAYYREFQQYMQGAKTLEQCADTLRPIFDQAVDKTLEDMGLDYEQYLTK